jgi:hypothetical protein
MVTITANEAVKALLAPLAEEAEIRDDRGELVGYFVPAASEVQRLRRKIEAAFDPAEIARRKASGQAGSTTAEVLERLGSPGRP